MNDEDRRRVKGMIEMCQEAKAAGVQLLLVDTEGEANIYCSSTDNPALVQALMIPEVLPQPDRDG